MCVISLKWNVGLSPKRLHIPRCLLSSLTRCNLHLWTKANYIWHWSLILCVKRINTEHVHLHSTKSIQRSTFKSIRYDWGRANPTNKLLPPLCMFMTCNHNDISYPFYLMSSCELTILSPCKTSCDSYCLYKHNRRVFLPDILYWKRKLGWPPDFKWKYSFE